MHGAVAWLRLCFCEPPPHDLVHVDQGFQPLVTQFTGQANVLHARASSQCGHALPPKVAPRGKGKRSRRGGRVWRSSASATATQYRTTSCTWSTARARLRAAAARAAARLGARRPGAEGRHGAVVGTRNIVASLDVAQV